MISTIPLYNSPLLHYAYLSILITMVVEEYLPILPLSNHPKQQSFTMHPFNLERLALLAHHAGKTKQVPIDFLSITFLQLKLAYIILEIYCSLKNEYASTTLHTHLSSFQNQYNPNPANFFTGDDVVLRNMK